MKLIINTGLHRIIILYKDYKTSTWIKFNNILNMIDVQLLRSSMYTARKNIFQIPTIDKGNEKEKKIVVMHPWLLCRVFSFSCTW